MFVDYLIIKLTPSPSSMLTADKKKNAKYSVEISPVSGAVMYAQAHTHPLAKLMRKN